MNNSTIIIGDQTMVYDETRKLLLDASGAIVTADVKRISDGEFSVLIGGRSIHCFLTRSRSGVNATVNNFIFEIQRESLRDVLTKKLQSDAGAGSRSVVVRAPMPGLITKLLRTEGAFVQQGEGILVIEAMKMENEIKAPRNGTVTKIVVKEKQTAEKNDHLFTIE